MTRAGVIAAGRGERLQNGGGSALKPLTTIAGRPLIDHVREVAIIINEASAAVREHVAAASWPFSVRWIVETTPSSMHSFLRVVETLQEGGGAAPFLISTVDTIAPPGAYARFAAAAAELSADVVLAVTRDIDADRPLLVEMAPGTERVVAIGDEVRPGSETEMVRLKPDPTSVRRPSSVGCTAGYYVVRSSVLAEAQAARADGLLALRQFFARLVRRGYRVAGVEVPGGVDVDCPDDVEAAEAFVRQVRA
jgi:NDP-sugar pyrophosphorylase family protein